MLRMLKYPSLALAVCLISFFSATIDRTFATTASDQSMRDSPKIRVERIETRRALVSLQLARNKRPTESIAETAESRFTLKAGFPQGA